MDSQRTFGSHFFHNFFGFKIKLMNGDVVCDKLKLSFGLFFMFFYVFLVDTLTSVVYFPRTTASSEALPQQGMPYTTHEQ